MATLDQVLHHIVTDVESKQTIAAFATAGSAVLWAEELEARTGRELKISDTRRRSNQGTITRPPEIEKLEGPTD